MKDPNNPCLFCSIRKNELAFENELAYASYDTYPVSLHHCLIIPKRHIKDYFELTDSEIGACNQLIKKVRKEIEIKDHTVKGFNVGTNSGIVAGQSISVCYTCRKCTLYTVTIFCNPDGWVSNNWNPS